MQSRIGVVAVIVEDERRSAASVNEVLSQFAHCIRARLGVPNLENDLHVIALVVEITTEELGALTGRLGRLAGVTVKSLLTNKTYERGCPQEPARPPE